MPSSFCAIGLMRSAGIWLLRERGAAARPLIVAGQRIVDAAGHLALKSPLRICAVGTVVRTT